MTPATVDLRALPVLRAVEEMGFRCGRASITGKGKLCAFKIRRPDLAELVAMNPAAFDELFPSFWVAAG